MGGGFDARAPDSLGTLFLLSGCYSTTPTEPDGAGPRLRLTSMSGLGRPFYEAPTPPDPTDNRCFKPRGFSESPARLALNLNDAGGLDHAEISILVGTIVEGSLVAAPDWTVRTIMDGGTQRTTVTFVPTGDDRVLTGALVVFNVSASVAGAGTALEITGEDRSGNRTTLAQIDLRTQSDPTTCPR